MRDKRSSGTIDHSFPVLLVDDEPEMLRSLSVALRSGGIKNIRCTEDSREVLPLLSQTEIETILLDLTLPHISGEELLDKIVQDFPHIPVIIVTGNDEIETAVKCMQAKAFDYMVKPVEKSRLISGVKRAIEIRELMRENQNLRERILTGTLKHPEVFSDIVTVNQSMLSVFRYVESIANSSQPVLINGETGVGKELMARAIHALSERYGPLVSVNVAGIDDQIFSDTLFGHVKGAYTGAEKMRSGMVEKATGGTLLLDEIGDLSLESQVKILRLLQEQEYFPIGSDIPKKSDIRLIFTTHRDLEALQQENRFRKDLYYRLCTHSLNIPPLRERPDDMQLIVDHFLDMASRELGRDRPVYPRELITLLMNYDFPGNVRELKAMVHDAVASLKSKKLSMERFRAHIEKHQAGYSKIHGLSAKHPGDWFSGPQPLPTLEEATLLLFSEAMKRCNQNQSMAAQLLGISRQRLARHLKAAAKS